MLVLFVVCVFHIVSNASGPWDLLISFLPRSVGAPGAGVGWKIWWSGDRPLPEPRQRNADQAEP